MKKITRDDLVVERRTSHWGGPAALVTVNAGPLAGQSFHLRSTEGLDDEVASLGRGGGIHVDAGDPDGDGGPFDWLGAFKTLDMDEAIGWMVDEVNDMALRSELQDRTWSELSSLETKVKNLQDALSRTSRLDWRKEWEGVKSAVAALALRIAEVSFEEEEA